MSDILVFCEFANGKVKASAKELLGKSKDFGGTVTGVVLGSGIGDAAAGLGAWGADKVLVVDDAALAAYVPGTYAAALAQVVGEVSPDAVLGPASPMGRDLFPRAALLCDASVGIDVVDLVDGDDGLEAVRPIYAGKCLVTVKLDCDPKFFTVRANSFVLGDVAAGAGVVEAFAADLGGDYGYEVIEVESAGGDTIDVAEATVIISGGRAMKSAEGFAIFEEPAKLLGAAVGSSRAAVDAGYIGHATQVGQTGKVVNPNLYFACGISGAIQHLAGMRTSKVIVAINKDADAPIFQNATYGIVGDLFEVVPMLTGELKTLLAE